jgi:hypothetical protein
MNTATRYAKSIPSTSAAPAMSHGVQALVIRNLQQTIEELEASQHVRSRQLDAVRAELARAVRGEW